MKIPKEGFCKTRKREIIQFFRNLYPDCKERLQVEHIGIAWNKGSFWFIKEHSFKPLISEELLLNIIQLKVGKWYEVELMNKSKHFIKFINVDHGEAYFDELGYIADCKKWSKGISITLKNITNLRLINTEEIQQYLPDDHPDKLSKLLTIGDLVEGEIYYCLNNTICKWGKNNSTHSLNIEDKDFWNNESGCYSSKYNFRLATPEEKYWLLTCIAQGKFIPKEELDKYDSEGNLIEVKQQFKVGDWVYADRQSDGDFRYELGDSYIPIFKVEEIYRFSAASIWLRPIKNRANGIESKYCRLATPEEIAKVNKPVDKPFEFNKWYKSQKNDGLFFIKSENTGYGFRSNHKNYWFVRTSDMGNWDLNNLIPAEDSEVKERLLNYAKEKYPIGTRFYSLTGSIHTVDEYHIDLYAKIRTITDSYSTIFRKDTGKWAEIISTPKMQLSDLKNPVFNIGDKVRVIANSLEEFNSSWMNGNNTNYKKDYIGVVTGVLKSKSSFCEVDTWYYLDYNESNTISCNLLELVEPVKKEFDRNWYVEVNSQKEANKVFDWLESQGENTFRGHAYFSKTSKYIRQWNNTESKYHSKWFLSSVKHNKPQKQLSDILPEYKQPIQTEEKLSHIIDTNEELRYEMGGLLSSEPKLKESKVKLINVPEI